MSKKSNGNYLVQAWLVLILAMVFGSALASVEINLAPTIAANKEQEIKTQLPALILGAGEAAKMADKGEAMTFTLHKIPVTQGGRTTTVPVYQAQFADKRTAGWAIKTSGQGYADKIEMLFGLDGGAKSLTGIFILDQKETPGLGNKIIEDWWRAQFVGKMAASPIEAVKSNPAGNQIDALTGATISSRAVCQIINTATAGLRKPLAAKMTQ